MMLMLTTVSVIALWTFLTLLVVALLLVYKTLEAIRGMLSRIVAGVRAIERETAPLERLTGEVPFAGDALARALTVLAGPRERERGVTDAGH